MKNTNYDTAKWRRIFRRLAAQQGRGASAKLSLEEYNAFRVREFVCNGKIRIPGGASVSKQRSSRSSPPNCTKIPEPGTSGKPKQMLSGES